jgi:hypothetical protein
MIRAPRGERTMKIRTYYDPPPIPVRGFDWIAIDDNTYEADSPIGLGATEQEAIEDLKQKMEDRA